LAGAAAGCSAGNSGGVVTGLPPRGSGGRIEAGASAVVSAKDEWCAGWSRFEDVIRHARNED